MMMMLLSSPSKYDDIRSSIENELKIERDGFTFSSRRRQFAPALSKRQSNQTVSTAMSLISSASFITIMTILCMSSSVTEARSPFVTKHSLYTDRISSSLSSSRRSVAWLLQQGNGGVDSMLRDNLIFNGVPRGGALEDDEEEDSESDEQEKEENGEDAVEQEDENDDEEEEEVVVVKKKKKKTRRKLSKSLKQLKVREKETAGTQVGESAYDEPYFASPMLQLYTTFGFMLISRKLDLFQPKVVRIARFAFIAYIVALQAFIFYVRIQAKLRNDRTPITMTNPLSSIIENQLGGGNSKEASAASSLPGGLDMVKNLASSFLSSASTFMEYDLSQARSMQAGVLFNMAFMWFLHFKMEQVQPLFIQTATGLLNLAYSPLFQAYVMGRNLERPFKQPPSRNPLAIPGSEEPTEAAASAADVAGTERITATTTTTNKAVEFDSKAEDDSDDEVSKFIEEVVGGEDEVDSSAGEESADDDDANDEE